MRLTNISAQKKQTHRYNIFIDDAYSFSLDESIIIKLGLEKGMYIDEILIKEAKELDSLTKAKSKAFYYLSFKDRTVKEVYDYLTKNNLDSDAVDRTISYLITNNYLSDKRYSNNFVKYRASIKKHGPIRIKQELLKKGIAKSIIEEALIDYEFDLKEIVDTVKRKYKDYNSLSYEVKYRKIGGFLLRRGHDYSIVKKVIGCLDGDENV